MMRGILSDVPMLADIQRARPEWTFQMCLVEQERLAVAAFAAHGIKQAEPVK